MSGKRLAKVMKFELRYLDGCGDFHTMQERLWALQRQTREILNKTIQESFHWDYRKRQHLVETGEELDLKNETGYKRLDGYIYHILADQFLDMASSNLNATIQRGWKRYQNSKPDVLRGKMSVPSYKRDQPLVMHKNSVKIEQGDGLATVSFTLFSNAYRKKNPDVSRARFSFFGHDGTQRAILERLLTGEYECGECQLVYEKKKWLLLLTYCFKPTDLKPDKDRILGVDLGEKYALYASIFGERGALRIEGGEVTAFAEKLEARRRSKQHQTAVCGEGRIGHGTKTRVAPVYQEEDRIAAFRDTINHRYSKALVEYAVKNGCGTIQMEDLTGIREDTGFPKKLRHWTYYDLQQKITAKAAERGIAVEKIRPAYTSQRCSRCGCIDRANRPTQERFCCVSCGFETNADYNASQNIAVKGIEKLIQETSANR